MDADPIWLCGRLFLVTDSDNATGAKKDRHDKLKEKLKERYCCLEVTEVENLLTPEVVKQVVQTYEATPPTFPAFSQQDYKDKKLGAFIETVVLGRAKTRSGSYMEKSGTVTNKPEFCDRALGHIKSFGELSAEAQLLTKKLYEFIAQHN